MLIGCGGIIGGPHPPRQPQRMYTICINGWRWYDDRWDVEKGMEMEMEMKMEMETKIGFNFSF